MTLIVALDALGGDIGRIEELSSYLCGLASGFKVGWPNIIRGGVEVVKATKKSCEKALLIADLKLADIGYTMIETVKPLIDYVDGVIAQSFIGVNGALGELKSFLREKANLILVEVMSHPGASEVMDPCLPRLVSVAKKIKPWGIVAPATRPWVIRILRKELGSEVKILAPGVGAQGAEPGSALMHGADYEIVGRYITMSSHPLSRAMKVISKHRAAKEGQS